MISVGIDVSKEKNMICILKPYEEILKSPYEIAYTETSIDDLVTEMLED